MMSMMNKRSYIRILLAVVIVQMRDDDEGDLFPDQGGELFEFVFRSADPAAGIYHPERFDSRGEKITR